jgi:two-component system phosphate regulon response regulator PhoB
MIEGIITSYYDKMMTKPSRTFKRSQNATMSIQILIIDDEEAIRDMLRFTLEKQHFSILEAGDCRQADKILAAQTPALILLDWMLPDHSGIEYATTLKKNATTANIPIIMLTAKAEEYNKIRGFEEAQVDDYVTKPFSPRELAGRIKAVLRRGMAPDVGDNINFASLTLDHDRRLVTIAGQPVELTPKLFKLLYFFLTHRDKVYSREQILDALAKSNEFLDERSVDRQVKRLRDILMTHDYADYIKTIRGHGYQFVSKR